MVDNVTKYGTVIHYGSFHQGDDRRFAWHTRGRQCVPNSISGIALSKIHNITLWDRHDLDRILIEGDGLYRHIQAHSSVAGKRHYADGLLEYEDIPDVCNLFMQQFSIVKIGQICCDTSEMSIHSAILQLDQSTTLCDAIVVMGDATGAYACSMMYQHNKTYIFDAHSRSRLNGMPCENGSSVLIAFDTAALCAKYLAECANVLHAIQVSVWKVSVHNIAKDTYQQQVPCYVPLHDAAHGKSTTKKHKVDHNYNKKCSKQTNLSCKFCNSVIDNVTNYQRHISACERKHLKRTQLYCPTCNHTFDNNANLASHMAACPTKHDKMEQRQHIVYRCDICSKTVENLTNFERHTVACKDRQKRIRQSNMKPCNVCGIIICNAVQLKQHMQQCNGQSTVFFNRCASSTCTVCDYVCDSKPQLKSHMDKYHPTVVHFQKTARIKKRLLSHQNNLMLYREQYALHMELSDSLAQKLKSTNETLVDKSLQYAELCKADMLDIQRGSGKISNRSFQKQQQSMHHQMTQLNAQVAALLSEQDHMQQKRDQLRSRIKTCEGHLSATEKELLKLQSSSTASSDRQHIQRDQHILVSDYEPSEKKCHRNLSPKANNAHRCDEISAVDASKQPMTIDHQEPTNSHHKQYMRKYRTQQAYKDLEHEHNKARMKKIRLDTNYKNNEQKSNRLRMKKTRQDTEYKSVEQTNNQTRMQKLRLNTNYVSQEHEHNKNRMQRARLDIDYKRKEQANNTACKRQARSDTDHRMQEQERQGIRRETTTYGVSLADSIQRFLEVTSEGPIYVCSACNQTHFRDHVQDVTTLQASSHDTTLQLCLTGVTSIDNKEWLCNTCKRDIYQDLIPKLSVANKVGFPECPPELQLNTLEELLIAPLMPFMTIRSLPVCGQTTHGQKLIVGNVVHVPNDIASTVRSLPRLLDDMGTIPVKLKRKKSYKTSVFQENIRPLKVIRGLEYLLTHSEMFQHYNIPLNTSPWLDHIASSDHDNRYFVEDKIPPQPEDTEDGEHIPHDQSFEEITSPEFIHGNTDTMLVEDVPIYTDDMERTSTSSPRTLSGAEILTLAPGEGQIPVFKEPRAEYLCFPTLFCGQERPTNSDRKRYVHTSDLFKAELRHSDTRVCFNIQNIFWKAKHLQIQHVANKVTLALRRVVGPRSKAVTAGILCDKKERDSITRLDEGYLIFRTIRNSPPYFEAKKKELMAMVRQLGIPTVFISLSSADTNWLPLLKCLGRLVDKQLYTSDYIKNEMTFEKKCQLVATHPAACSRFFNHRVEKFIKHVLNSPYSHFGHVDDYFYRVEFQHRGSPHIHGLLWIKNAPQYGRNTHRDICNYIDRCISCSLDLVDTEKQFVKLQMHKHSRTCRKRVKGQKMCRFGAPWPPLSQTCILDPLDKKTCTNFDEVQKRYHHIQKQLQRIPDNIRTFGDWLHHLNMDEPMYIEALRVGLIRPKVFIKRMPYETRVNSYMKHLLTAWQANHDAQFVLDPYQCVTYICDYLTKSQKGMSTVLSEACEQAKSGNMTLKQSVRHMGNALLNMAETPIQECVYDILQLPITNSTRKKEFISTCLPEERVALTKSTEELETMNPKSKDVTHKSNIDRYTMRPKKMESWCLADYVAKIDIEYPQKNIKSKNGTNLQFDNIPDEVPDPECTEMHLQQISYDDIDDFPLVLRNGLKLKLRTKNKVIRFVHYRQKSNPEQYARERMLLYIPWRHEDKILGECGTYQEAFTLHRMAIKSKMAVYEPLSSILEDVEEELAEENHEDDIVIAPSTQYPDEIDCDSNEMHMTCANTGQQDHVPFDIGPYLGLPPVHDDPIDVECMQHVTTDAEHVQLVSSLNRGQQEFLSHIMHSALQGTTQILCALHGGAGTGKSTAIRAIHQGLYKLLNKQPGCDPSIQRVLLVAPTGKAAYNIRGTTIHRAFCIAANQKLEYRQLTRDRLNTIRNQFQGIQWLLVDEVSMVGNRMLQFMHLRLQEIRGNKLPFGGLHMIFVGDLYQLQPVMQQYIFMDQPSPYGALATNLWKEYFTVYELKEIMRQKGDKQFAELLNRLRTGDHTEDDINVLKTRTITAAESLKMSDIPHFFPTRDSTEVYNTNVLNCSTGFTVTVDAMDAAPTDMSHNMQEAILAAARHKNVNSTGGLAYTLILKVGQLYDVTANLDVTDGIINGSECHIRYIEPNLHNRKFPRYVWVQFTDQNIGRERRRKCMQVTSDRTYAIQKFTPIEAIQRTFTVKHDQTVVRTQFPLRLASARTIHVAQSSTYEKIVVDMSTEKKPPKHFWDHMHYVAFSRCTSLQGLYILDINEATIHTSDRVKQYLAHDKRHMQLCYVPTYTMENHLHVVYNNVGSIQYKWPAIKYNHNINGAHVIILAETWLSTTDNNTTYELPGFCQYRYNSSQVLHHRGLLMYVKDDIEPICTSANQNIYIEMCHCDIPFNDRQLQIVGIYKPPTTTLLQLKRELHHILSDMDLTIPLIVLGDFNLDINSEDKYQFVDYMFAEYSLCQQIKTSTTWAGTCIDLVFSNCSDSYTYALTNTWSMHHVLFTSLPG